MASTGAAWLTDWSIRPCSDALSGRSWATSTEPITSPPTSEGTHVVRACWLQRSQVSSGSLSVACACVRPSRTARHELGEESTSFSAIGLAGVTGVAASSRFWLLFRFRTTISEPASDRSRCRLTSACASPSFSVTCSVSANSRWEAWYCASASRRCVSRWRIRLSSRPPTPANATLSRTIRRTARSTASAWRAALSASISSTSLSFCFSKLSIRSLREAVETAEIGRPLRIRITASLAIPAQRSAIRSCSAIAAVFSRSSSAKARARSAAAASAAVASS